MKKLYWIIFLLLLFLLSYFREVTFIGLNAIVDGAIYNYANTQLPAYFYTLSQPELNQLKWLLTIIYSLLFMVISTLGIYLSVDKTKVVWILIIYIIISIIAGGIILFGLIVLDFRTIYPFLRILIGVIHSPLLYLLISISAYSMSTLKK